jgi:hypothetical protein
MGMTSFPTRSATRPENGAIRGCRDVLRRRLDGEVEMGARAVMKHDSSIGLLGR